MAINPVVIYGKPPPPRRKHRLRDIRKGLPQTKQTDSNEFPPYEFKDYPKMMTFKEGKKNRPYTHTDGSPIIVSNPDEEAAFNKAAGLDQPVGETETDDDPKEKRYETETNTPKPPKKSDKKKPKDLD